MPVKKFKVRSTCLSCGTKITGTTVALITEIKEDNQRVKAYLLHESCQSNMIRDIPFDN